MLPISLPLAPGVDIMRTPLQVGKGIVDSNLIRHRNGLVQKLGGCSRMSNLTFNGTCRALFGWQDLIGNHYLAVGTSQMIELFTGVFTIISPAVHTSNLVLAAFATVLNSNVISITDASGAAVVGGWISITNMTYINGVVLQGPYQIQTVVGSVMTIIGPNVANATGSGASVLNFTTINTHSTVQVTLAGYTFTNMQSIIVAVSTAVGGLTLLGSYTLTFTGGLFYLTASGNATSGASVFENSDTVQVVYYSTLPPETTTFGAYGNGAYGSGPYGTGGSLGGSDAGLIGSMPGVLFLNEFSFDRWGQNLVACWVGSTIYQWVPPLSPGNLLAAVSGAPTNVTGLFVAAPQQQTMAWGAYSSVLSAQDPMLVAWCDVANLNQWTAAVNNQAGSFRLSSGNLIISGTWFGQVGLLWTDLDLWQMTYIGFPLVYGFNKVAPNCGLISRRAWATMGTLAAWLSQNDFFVYQGGAVTPLTCTVRDFIFNTIDRTNAEAIHADSNTTNGEITWWFPQIGSNGICTGAVKWHTAGGEWDIVRSGLTISAWTDQSVLGNPIGSFYTGLLEQFETAIDFDGQILDSYIISGYFQIAEGEEFIYVDRIFPDFTLSAGASITMTFYFANDMASMTNPQNPGDIRTYGPYTVTAATKYIIVRGRGRVMQFRVDCNTAYNSFWRYGEPLMQCAIDGRR
jgi:hypothetical protein